SELYLRVREYCHGLSYEKESGRAKESPGSLDGVMNRWIDVLTLFSRKEVVRDDLFLAPLYTFLTTPEVDLCHLASAWKQTCDVSPEFMADKVSPLKAMRCVNSFRNRFAHVPFPHDQIVSVS